MFSSLKSAWMRLLARSRWEEEMDDEMRFHVEARTAHLAQQGIPLAEAARQARVEFGGVEPHKQLCRESFLLVRAADELRRNLSYSARSLRKSPGFTLIGVLSLGLGIGANVATFSLIERLMWNDLPVRNPHGLYQVGNIGEHGFQSSQSYVHFDAIRSRHPDLFAGALAWSSPYLMEMRTGDRLERARTTFVSGSYFPLLGIQAHLGRAFGQDDDRPGMNVAMLGYDAWLRLFGGDRRVIEQTIQMGAVPFQIVGVAPPGFYGTELGDPPDVFITLHGNLNFNKNAITAEGAMWLHTMVRLQPGVPVKAATEVYGQRSIESGKALRKQFGRLDKPKMPVLEPGGKGYSPIRNEYVTPLLVLMGLVGAVLLIACANLATLLFVRGAGRSGETSLRLALGASHGQLMRQWMTECMIIATAGGALAFVLARWIVDILLLFVNSGVRQYLQFHPNPRIVTFAGALTLATLLLFGVVPSLRASSVNPGRALKESQPSIAGKRRRSLRWVLAFQVAASLLLVTGAALFARTLWNLSTASGGFGRSEVVWGEPRFSREAPVTEDQIADALERLRQSPILAAVSMGRVPLKGGGGWNWATVPGYVAAPEEDNIVYFSSVSPGYFRAMGIAMLSGRDLEEKDRVWPPKAIVVSESFVRHYFKDRDPIGVGVSVYRSQPSSTIVGVVRDARYAAFRESMRDVVYSVAPGSRGTIIARPKRPEDRVQAMEEIRAALKATAPHAVVMTGTMEELVQKSIQKDQLLGQLSALFGVLGLIIASIGLYGAMAYEVSRQRREIAVRIALGASSWNIMRLTLAEVGIVLGLGFALGTPVCLLGTRFIQSLLFEVSPMDPLAFTISAVVLAMSALLAALAPARRATRLDPTQSLRCD